MRFLPALLRLRPFEIEREQAGEGVVGGDVLRPAVSGGDGPVEGRVGVGEPARALVVEIGERALLELDRGLGVLGDDAVRIVARRNSSSRFAAAAMACARGSFA